MLKSSFLSVFMYIETSRLWDLNWASFFLCVCFTSHFVIVLFVFTCDLCLIPLLFPTHNQPSVYLQSSPFLVFVNVSALGPLLFSSEHYTLHDHLLSIFHCFFFSLHFAKHCSE